ncbi:SHOCT domain-containing protein [Halanaeroarchaeum sulfurireducens]|uniref:SHOCT domain-containing protein n=1 Tax=Halanaeroarchaeum sulfurireducens TaxID=1604004 RepID=A0A0F7PAW6_9EURY|nr:SHOCT domain-containing protein [Halanaeroarchaeum sulfurireducens]AKH97857.1 hypothetical protein HLASF_1372 [Halanaeroarchaeum sulfurireducens]ALG82251.1 hypothetical protein HLASA_1359 [Halanaeroarchaeum sulfurireducens]
MDRFAKRAGLIAILLGGIAVITPAFFSGTSTMGVGGYGGMMGSYGSMMGGYGGAGGVGTAGPLVWLVPQLGMLLLLVGGGYLLYRLLETDASGQKQGSSNVSRELRLAYARGELSDEEFEKRRGRLRQEGDQ